MLLNLKNQLSAAKRVAIMVDVLKLTTPSSSASSSSDDKVPFVHVRFPPIFKSFLALLSVLYFLSSAVSSKIYENRRCMPCQAG